MAPKSTQHKNPTPHLSSLDGTISRAVEKLANEVSQEKKIIGPIKALGALSELRDSLRAYRKVNTKISTINISKLVDILNNHGRSICGDLEPQIFSVIVGALLQGNGCRDAQHGLCLLATSLYDHSHSSENQRALQKRLDVIGRETLQPLLNYFVDESKPASMRRWAIILGHQLLLNSEGNRSQLELGSDKLRHKIGPLMVDETNDHIRVLCGQLVRDLVANGILVGDLFPANYNEKLYKGFPGSTQGNKGWSALFENWVGDVWTQIGRPQSTIDLHFGAGFSILPLCTFGNIERNVYVLVVDDELSILALVSENNMENILDVPLPSIHHMTVDYQAHSQYQGYANIMLEIKPMRNTFCYLNTVPSKVESVHMSVEVSSVERLKALFSQNCSDFKVTEQSESYDPAQASTIDNGKDGDESPNDITSHNTVDKVPQVKIGKLLASQSQDPIQVDRESLQRYAAETEAYIGVTVKDQESEVSRSLHLANHETEVRANEETTEDEVFQMQAKEKVTTTNIQNKKQTVRPRAKKPIIGSRKKDRPDTVSVEKEKDVADALLTVSGRNPATVVFLSMKNSDTEPLKQSSTFTSAVNDSSITRKPENRSARAIKSSKRSVTKATYGLRPTSKKLVIIDGDFEDTTSEGSDVVSTSKGKPRKVLVDSPTINNPKPQTRRGVTSKSSVERAAKVPKRYGLYNKKDDASNVYDISKDDDNESPKPNGKVPPADKANAKSRKSAGAITKKYSARKIAAKKRQSAPALLQETSSADCGHVDKEPQKTRQNSNAKIIASRATRAVDSSDGDAGFEIVQEDTTEVVFVKEKPIGRETSDEVVDTTSRRATQTTVDVIKNHQAKTDANVQTAVGQMANKLEHLLELEDTEEAGQQISSSSSVAMSREGTSIPTVDKDLAMTQCHVSSDETHSSQAVGVQNFYGNGSKQQTHDRTLQDTTDNLQGRSLKTPTAKRKSKEDVFKSSSKRQSVEKNENRKPSVEQGSRISQNQSGQESPQPKMKIASSIEPVKSIVAKNKATEIDVDRNKLSKSALIDEHLARKQQMISFDEHGPRNQGLSSIQKLLGNKSIEQKISADLQSPASKHTQDLKRKRVAKVVEGSLSDEDPPAKRSSPSPPQPSGNTADKSKHRPIFNSSPPSQPKEFTVQIPLTKRTSSRMSRVNLNGSPVASPSIPKIDHIDKLRRKLFDNLHDQHTLTEIGQDGKRPRRLSQIFGPQLTLGGQPKARPSSPQELVERYIPHKKTARGAYEELQTKDLIEVQDALADPFDAKGRQTTFTNRLGLITKARHLNKDRQSPVKHQLERLLTPNDLTSCSTDRSSESPKTPEKAASNELWNMPLRPHYTVLADAVHRVADEVIIQLAGEEDKMNLLAKDYKEKGARLVKSFEDRRNKQQCLVVDSVEKRKVQLLGLYRDSKQLVQKARGEYAGSAISEFEKYWRTQQSVIHDKVGDNMRRGD